MSSKLMVHLLEVQKLPSITLEKLSHELKEEALVVVCLISILPFMQPIPIPGVSTILGLVALLQGMGLMIQGRPLLTKKMKELTIPHDKFEKLLKGAEKFSLVVDKISVFRHPWTNSRASRFIGGLAIMISGAFLSLPLPIPFSNFIPALSIALICIGLLEEDLVLLLMGLTITTTIIWMGIISYQLILEMFPILNF